MAAESFGLSVYFVADLDYAYERFYPGEHKDKLVTPAAVATFKAAHLDCNAKIATDYANKVFILRDGTLEIYLGIPKGLLEVIEFCNKNLRAYLANDADAGSVEIRDILKFITA